MHLTKTIAKMSWAVAVMVGLSGFLGHRNHHAVVRTDRVDGVKLYRFENPVRQTLLASRNVDLLSAYDDVRHLFGLPIHVATLSLLAPKAKLACHFQTYQAAQAISWHAQNENNIGIVADYLIDNRLPFSLRLHSVVADTRANGAGEKKYLHRQLKKSYAGLQQAGIVVRENDTFRLAASYQRTPHVATDYGRWQSFNDRFVSTRDMADEIVFRLSPPPTSMAFYPSPLNRFNARQETVTFKTPTLVNALVRAQIDLDRAVVAHIPRGLMLPIVRLLRTPGLRCGDG